MALQLRRGTDADRMTITPVEGELVFTTDTQLLYVGDGTTTGGISAGGALAAPFIATNGGSSMFIGNNSGTQNEAGNNTAFGNNALASNLYSQNNTAIGADTLVNLGKITNADQVIVGFNYKIVDAGDTDWTAMGAGDNNVGTVFNVSAVGSGTGTAAATGAERNTVLGHQAGQNLEVGFRNNYFGRGAGFYPKDANSQCMFGQAAGFYHGGNASVGIGRGAAQATGNNSVGIGAFSLQQSGLVPGSDLVSGHTYLIVNPGGTDWTEAGAPDSWEGTTFTATGPVTTYNGGFARSMSNPAANNSVGIGYLAGAADGSMGMTGDNNVFIGANTKPLAATDEHSIVIGNDAIGAGSNSIVLGKSTNEKINAYGNLQLINGSLIVPASSGTAIQVDPDAPSYTWRDITASLKARTTGTAVPNYAAYAGTSIYAYNFSNTLLQELFVEFHIPHDYVPGTDLFIHTHWSQTAADAGTAVKWNYDALYSRGHNQDSFPGTVTTVSVTQNASSTVRRHMVAEVQLTTSGSLGGQPIEADGIILVRMWRDPADAADTLTVAPFAHFCDLHYQSSNIGTKNKAPAFFG